MNWREYCQTRLLESQPGSLCAIDDQAYQLARRVLPDIPVCLHNPLPDPPPDIQTCLIFHVA